jgi:hypothetical protein
MLNKYATRVVVNAPVSSLDAPDKNKIYAELLNEEGITYILDMPLVKGTSTNLTPEEFDSVIQKSVEGGTKSVIISSNYLANESIWNSILKMSLYKEIYGIDDAQLFNLYDQGRYEILKEKLDEIKELKKEEIVSFRNQSKTKINSLEVLVQSVESRMTNAKNLNLDTSKIDEKWNFGRREYSLSKTSFIEGRYKESLDQSDNAEIVLKQVDYELQTRIDSLYSSRMFIGFTIIIVFVIFLFLIYYLFR